MKPPTEACGSELCKSLTLGGRGSDTQPLLNMGGGLTCASLYCDLTASSHICIFMGKDCYRNRLTTLRMSRGEIHLDSVKKMVYRVPNKPQQPKWAILACFEGRRGSKKTGSNEFWPDITYPYVYVVIFAKKTTNFFFFNLTTLYGSVAHSVSVRVLHCIDKTVF